MNTSLHLYYPQGVAIPGFVDNERSVAALLVAFFAPCGLLCISTLALATASQPRSGLSRKDLATVVWLILSASIHIFIEGYYITHFYSLAADQTIIGQIWKEYALSDSRYLTRDPFLLCVEAVTVLCWGPGCLLLAALIVLRHPVRYVLQIIVSLGQFYGCTLYFLTAAFDLAVVGTSYSRPEPFYFWFYFVFINSIWLIIPALLICDSIGQIKAMTLLSENKSQQQRKH